MLLERKKTKFFNFFPFAIQKCSSLEEALNVALSHKDSCVMPHKGMEDPLLYASIICVQYCREALGVDNWLTFDHLLIPARKDASASVFQIISSISGEQDLALYSNIVDTGGKINDLYTKIFDDFLNWFKLNNKLVVQFVRKLGDISEENTRKKLKIKGFSYVRRIFK